MAFKSDSVETTRHNLPRGDTKSLQVKESYASI